MAANRDLSLKIDSTATLVLVLYRGLISAAIDEFCKVALEIVFIFNKLEKVSSRN